MIDDPIWGLTPSKNDDNLFVIGRQLVTVVKELVVFMTRLDLEAYWLREGKSLVIFDMFESEVIVCCWGCSKGYMWWVCHSIIPEIWWKVIKHKGARCSLPWLHGAHVNNVEDILTNICLQGMIEDYWIYWENLYFSSLSWSVEATRRTNEPWKRHWNLARYSNPCQRKDLWT